MRNRNQMKFRKINRQTKKQGVIKIVIKKSGKNNLKSENFQKQFKKKNLRNAKKPKIMEIHNNMYKNEAILSEVKKIKAFSLSR